MSNYKVGDLASLMSPASTTKTSKLQHLFNEHWKRNPTAMKEAKMMKSKLKNSITNSDAESSPKKKKKKSNQNSSATNSTSKNHMKKIETDFNSDFLDIDSQNGEFKKTNSNAEKKRKNSFPANSAIKKKKISEEQSNDVKAFIRCPKNKKKKTAGRKSANSTSEEPNQMSEMLFSEPMHKLKKQKIKNSKQNFKNFSNDDMDSEEESFDAFNIEAASLQENLFSETSDTTNNKSKKQKTKKSKMLLENDSDDDALMDGAKEDSSAESESDSEKNQADAKKGKANPKKNKANLKKSKANINNNKVDTNNDSFADSDVEGNEYDSEKTKADSKKSKADAKKIWLQNQKDLPFTLFVGNLPVSINRKELHKIFAPFGQIKSVRVRGAVSTKLSIPKKVAEIKNEYHKGLQSHTGFVIFKDKESANDALSLNGTLVDNRHIVVDFASQAGAKKHYSSDLSVFIGNLPFDVDDETVRSAFEEYGEIHALRIIRDKDTGVGKGFGYIQFEEVKSRDRALGAEDLEINGRTIRVSPIKGAGEGKKPGAKKTVMMIRNNVAAAKKRIKESGNKKSVKKLLKKGKQMHKRKQVARLLGEKFVK